MSEESEKIKNKLLEVLGDNAGLVLKAGANLLFPRDFEYYMCGLELTTYDGDIIDYFIFPIMPNSIRKEESNRISVSRTFGGVTILGSDSPTTDKIVLSGNFGRSFRLIARGSNNPLSGGFKGLAYSIEKGIYNKNGNKTMKKSPLLYPSIKSGFGCTKILQSIISKAGGCDKNGNPFRLYFHNPSLSESYYVVPSKEALQLNQDVGSNNMMWNYNLNLEIIAPLDSLIFNNGNKSNNNLFLAASVIQDIAHKTARDAIKYGVKMVPSVKNKIKNQIDEIKNKIQN